MRLVHPRLQALAKSPLPPFVKGGARRVGIQDRKGCVSIFLPPCAKGDGMKQGEIGNHGSCVRILCGVIYAPSPSGRGQGEGREALVRALEVPRLP
jgi:hypothetical protein